MQDETVKRAFEAFLQQMRGQGMTWSPETQQYMGQQVGNLGGQMGSAQSSGYRMDSGRPGGFAQQRRDSLFNAAQQRRPNQMMAGKPRPTPGTGMPQMQGTRDMMYLAGRDGPLRPNPESAMGQAVGQSADYYSPQDPQRVRQTVAAAASPFHDTPVKHARDAKKGERLSPGIYADGKGGWYRK